MNLNNTTKTAAAAITKTNQKDEKKNMSILK